RKGRQGRQGQEGRKVRQTGRKGGRRAVSPCLFGLGTRRAVRTRGASRVTLLGLFFTLVAALPACGGGAGEETGAGLPPPNPVAVSKLAQGVDASKDKSGRKRAIELLEQAVAADGQLWEGRYNLGVLLAENGDLVASEKQLAKAQELAPNAEDV